MRFVVLMGLTALVTALVGGCGSSSSTTENTALTDAQQLAALVTEFNDTGTPLSMSKYFVAGSRIGQTEYRKYIAHTYKVTGTPEITGTTATAQVTITTATDSKDLGTREWSFVKEGNTWKLKDAPLP